MISLKDIYWAAGFLEGEGHFCLDGNLLAVGAVQVQRWPIDKLVGLFGGHVRVQDTQKETGRKPIHRWEIHADRAAALAMTLYTMMSPKRKEQIEKGLKAWKKVRRNPGKGKRNAYCMRGHRMDVWNRKGGVKGKGGCKECARNSKRMKAVKRNYGDLSGQGMLAL